MQIRKMLPLLAAALLLLAACDTRGGPDGGAGSAAPPQPQSGEGAGSAPPAPSAADAPDRDGGADGETTAGGRYIDRLVTQTVERFCEPGMGEFERVKAAFDYMIAETTLLEPVGLELWRVRGGEGEPQPSFVENRAMSVLQHGVGMCEDYAAALTVLLRGMGLEALYVPGLTYSTQGALVDHAWTQVKIDGTWYHLDCQLEQNISKQGSIRYKYFLRGDATMRESHRWGQNLIDARLLTDGQNEEIARGYLMEPCPADYPTPARQSYTKTEAPDIEAVELEIAAEIAAYESTHGPLAPLELDIIPPVFGLEGYGPRD